MSSANLNTSYDNLDELSPSDNSEENSFDVNYLPSTYGVSVESGYYADSEFVPASSEQFPELGPNVYSDSYLGYDGSQVFPIYYPIPTYYQVYYDVSSVESNGTTYYHYYPFAIPVYCLSSEVTTENITSSDVSSMSDPVDFTNETFENVNEVSYSDPFTPSSNNGNDVASNDPPEELIDEFTEYYDEASYSDLFTPSSNDDNDVGGNSPPEELNDEFAEYYDEARVSSIIIPESDFMAEESKNDIKRKKDWLYLLSLSGKLYVKDHIPEVHVMPEILEEDEDVETSQGIFESGDSLDEELWTDVFEEIDKFDDDQKNPKRDARESSYANGPHKEGCQASGEEDDVWKDFFYSIDDPVFGIEACFNNTSEKELFNESFDNDLDKNNVNVLSTCRKTFMILPRLNKQIQILPTIEEEEEPVEKSENLQVMVQKTPVEINKENAIDIEEGCVESKQQNAEKFDNNCGLSEAIVEVGTSEKPKKKKRFKRIRRFFSEVRSCFRKSGSPPG